MLPTIVFKQLLLDHRLMAASRRKTICSCWDKTNATREGSVTSGCAESSTAGKRNSSTCLNLCWNKKPSWVGYSNEYSAAARHVHTHREREREKEKAISGRRWLQRRILLTRLESTSPPPTPSLPYPHSRRLVRPFETSAWFLHACTNSDKWTLARARYRAH